MQLTQLCDDDEAAFVDSVHQQRNRSRVDFIGVYYIELHVRIDRFYRIVEFFRRIQIQNRRNGNIVRHAGTAVFGEAPEHFDVAQMRADKQRTSFSIELIDQRFNVVFLERDFIKIDS